VLVFICIGGRQIEYVACASNPDGGWMLQQARNLLMGLDERGQRLRFLIHDRDAKFSHAFDSIFYGQGLRVIRTPVRAPNANAHLERWVGSLRRERLDRLLSSSLAASSSMSSVSMCGTTTNTGRTGRSTLKPPIRGANHWDTEPRR
jgi:transposase InsO family protein